MRKLFIENKIVINRQNIDKVKCEVCPINIKGDPKQDTTKPIFFWFQDTPFGKEIFLVLYTKKCRWARCAFCTLPSVSSPKKVSSEKIIKQAEYIFNELTRKQLKETKRLFISNNGSVLDQKTISPEALEAICQLGYENCPLLNSIAFETRIETVEKSELKYYIRTFQGLHKHYRKKGLRREKAPTKLEIAIGYETQDPFIRNEVLCKGYPEYNVQIFFKLCAEVNSETGFPISCDVYVLLKPLNGRLTSKELIAEAVQTIIHLDKLGKYFKIPVSVRLNPTFVAEGSHLHEKFLQADYSPPTLKDVITVLKKIHLEGIELPIFIGLSEEDLAVYGGSFKRDKTIDQLYYESLKIFNYSQDYELLKRHVDLIEKKYMKSPIGILSSASDLISSELENLVGSLENVRLQNLDEIIGNIIISDDELKKMRNSASIISDCLKKIKPIPRRKKVLHR